MAAWIAEALLQAWARKPQKLLSLYDFARMAEDTRSVISAHAVWSGLPDRQTLPFDRQQFGRCDYSQRRLR